MMIPDTQKLLRCELESLKNQLQAQTKVSLLSQPCAQQPLSLPHPPPASRHDLFPHRLLSS